MKYVIKMGGSFTTSIFTYESHVFYVRRDMNGSSKHIARVELLKLFEVRAFVTSAVEICTNEGLGP